MKIQAIRQHIGRHFRRWMAIGGVAMMSAASLTGNVFAQDTSGLGTGVSFRNGQLMSGGEAFTLISPSQVPTAASEISQADGASLPSLIEGGVAQVGLRNSGCRSCGTASCGGACGPGYGGYGFGGVCEPCSPYRYAFVEALYMKRLGDSQFSLSANEGLDDFDWELGPRITVGLVPNCVHGMEASVTGPLNWERREATDGAGLSSIFIPGLPVAATDLSAFNDNAVAQRQSHDADYWSVEASRTLIGWQIAKLLYGVRYIDYQEEYLFSSINAAADTGLFESSVENRLIGGQIGMDLFYPIARHAVADFRGRAGVYLNLAESDYTLANAGVSILNNDDSDEDIAGVFEIGSGVRVNLGEALSIRAGSELWYLTGIATAPGQVNQVVRPTDGRAIDLGEDVVIAGLTLSAELKY